MTIMIHYSKTNESIYSNDRYQSFTVIMKRQVHFVVDGKSIEILLFYFEFDFSFKHLNH